MLKRKVINTVFQGRVGDHNNLAMAGAMAIGQSLQEIIGIPPTVLSSPKPALNTNWKKELEFAMDDLHEVQKHFNKVFQTNDLSIAAISRCATSIAILPIVAKYYPDICIIWFDSHADLNTPESSSTGYLGGLALSGPLGLWESNLGAGLNFNQIILVGQRDLDPFEEKLIVNNNITHIKSSKDLPSKLRKAIAGRSIYIHLDCDVLEPGIVPTDYVHPYGLTLDDLSECSNVMAEHTIVGLEISEFQNSWESDGQPVSPIPLLNALAPIWL